MPRVKTNGIEIEVESFGQARDPAILLIMGLGGQMVLWPDDFCERLAGAGYRVVRFDNRDIGLSTKLDGLGRPPLLRNGIAHTLRLPVRAPYRLDDMALDSVGVLDALDIERAHVVGVSMGGMIAQLLAARHVGRVASLTSIMSSSGHRALPGPRFDVQLRLMKRPARLDREGLIAHGMQTWRMIGSPGYPETEADLRDKVARQIDRNVHPQGFVRQISAIMASGSRAPLLSQVRAPTLIIHGKADPLVPVAAAYDLKKRLPQARLEVIEGMGHDMPRALLPRIEQMILEHVGISAGESQSRRSA
ncbi:alpha/beta fold hydrolase [Sinimarinibacterium flocculans]|uniref:Pimeloyl-ACP methyl ester carboxylesterase n=1 Tax=Sinimarinibacterium flocculans TaxID=985250 RepID=A0A318EJR6_9GAMM|nr:alpha/beta hydrolase [Sinimarinibacterium flocculans]PXV69500.1 pimeloyl-ACP methyl ester carboxylesterase [Sinimarinibacterium flocculans]